METRARFEQEFEALVTKSEYEASKISDKEMCEIIYNVFPNLIECKFN